MVLSLQVPISSSCALTVCLMHHDHLIRIGYHKIKGKKNCVFSLIRRVITETTFIQVYTGVKAK